MRKNRYPIDRSELNILGDTLLKQFSKEKILLMPYFIIEDGKSVFLQTLTILYNDVNSDYTVLSPKPGAFKTSKQEDGGNDFSPFDSKAFTVTDYRRGINNFDLFGTYMRPLFHNKALFETLFSFYEKNFDKLKFNYLKTSKI